MVLNADPIALNCYGPPARVLIVSPHFAPTNAADMHRSRAVLPYLGEFGWQAEVLAVHHESVAAPVDSWLAAGLPSDIQVHRVYGLGLKWSKLPGLGILTYRALGALRRMGDRLLRSRRFDLIYFSTTAFGVQVLGPRWKKRYGIPFVIDYQDPWVNDYYREHPDVIPPGGRLKYAIADWLSRRQEPRVLQQCAGMTAVSGAYLEQLRRRYSFLRADWPSAVLPFPVNRCDIERVRRGDGSQSAFDPRDGYWHWVYVGVIGPMMHQSLKAFFQALREFGDRTPQFLQRLRVHFLGTSYAAAGTAPPAVRPLAEEYGLGPQVLECTDRIAYSSALRCLLDADALIIPGSNDAGYSASKIFPYLLARKPTLAVFHEQSPILQIIQRVGGATLVPFATNSHPVAIARQIDERWFQGERYKVTVRLDETRLEPYTARRQAETLSELFHEICNKAIRTRELGNNCNSAQAAARYSR